MILQVCPANGENKIENQALTKIQSDEEEIVDFSAQFVKSQEILKSEDDDHSGVQKARKIKFSPLKNPTSICDVIASLPAKGSDDSEEKKIFLVIGHGLWQFVKRNNLKMEFENIQSRGIF